jgi:hypothetical protein
MHAYASDHCDHSHRLANRPVMLSMPETSLSLSCNLLLQHKFPSMQLPPGVFPPSPPVIVNIDQNMMEAIIRNILGVQAGVTLSRPPLVSLPVVHKQSIA